MGQFLVDFGDKQEFFDFPSIKVLKDHLHRKFRKRRLHGITIKNIKKQNHKDSQISKIDRPDSGNVLCPYCERYYPDEEITLDDSLIASNICEGCYKHRKQIT